MPRSHLADERDRPGMLVPDTGMDWYATHVATRAQLCINMWLRAAMYAQGRNIAPRRSFFSDKAEAQVGRGLQNAPAGNLDAAHLMNTSFRPEQLDRGWEGNPPLRQIYYASAATTLQFATSNRSADKVIDGVQNERELRAGHAAVHRARRGATWGGQYASGISIRTIPDAIASICESSLRDDTPAAPSPRRSAPARASRPSAAPGPVPGAVGPLNPLDLPQPVPSR